MNAYDAILWRRSIRKYKQDKVDLETIKKIVAGARLAPQGTNLQPIKYLIVDDEKLVSQIHQYIKWAAYIRPEADPAPDETPVAYVALLCDTKIKSSGWDVDAGAVGATFMIGAAGEGLGTCWLGAIDREEVKGLLGIPFQYHLHSMIAIGYPAESPVIEDAQDDIKYYKDANGVMHVPKRNLEDIIFYNTMNSDK